MIAKKVIGRIRMIHLVAGVRRWRRTTGDFERYYEIGFSNTTVARCGRLLADRSEGRLPDDL
jgi:hypothetical protein